jgi:hypothetical protein
MFGCSAINSANENERKKENERRCKKGIMQFAKHVKQELVGDFQKR